MARRRRDENELGPIEVEVRGNNINRAINKLKRKVGREGINRAVKRHRYYIKPSDAKRLKSIKAERRRRKEERNKKKRKRRRY
jgi:small subunit ribosomal protein S21